MTSAKCAPPAIFLVRRGVAGAERWDWGKCKINSGLGIPKLPESADLIKYFPEGLDVLAAESS